MKNPCGRYVGMRNPIIERKTGGKLTQVMGKRGATKKFITGGK